MFRKQHATTESSEKVDKPIAKERQTASITQNNDSKRSFFPQINKITESQIIYWAFHRTSAKLFVGGGDLIHIKKYGGAKRRTVHEGHIDDSISQEI